MVDGKYWVGRAAADTLGFIAGDITGAVEADKLYQNYFMSARKRKSVANHGNRNKRVHSAPKPWKPRSATHTPLRLRGGAMTQQPNAASSGRTTRTPNVRTFGKKGVVFKKKPRVKVSKALRLKVNKVIDGEEPVGTFYTITHDLITRPNDNEQDLVAVGNRSLAAPGLFFDPLSVLHAASVLWNGKAWQPTYLWNSSLMFDSQNSSIIVEDSYAMLEFKNNTQRTMSISLYCCAPKTLDTTEPNAFWAQCLTREVAAGINLGPATTQSLGQTPYMCKEFMNSFRVETTSIVLEPGQTINHKVQGPQEKLYTYEKFGGGALLKNRQKFTRSLFAVIKDDLIMDNSNHIGRARGSTVLTAKDWCGYECKTYYKLRMPKKAGFKNGAAFLVNSPIELTLRHNVKFAKTWGMDAFNGLEARRVDEENPRDVEVL